MKAILIVLSAFVLAGCNTIPQQDLSHLTPEERMMRAQMAMEILRNQQQFTQQWGQQQLNFIRQATPQPAVNCVSRVLYGQLHTTCR